MATEVPDYSHMLRVVGQLLEALKVKSFTLRIENNDFLIRDRFPRRDRKVKVTKQLSSVWEVIRAEDARLEESFHETGVLMFRVTPPMIALLERAGQERRKNSGIVPASDSPSQILRAVGSFVSHQRGRLLEVSKNEQDVNFEFEAPSGQLVVERFTVSTLHDYWIRMYLKRTDRQRVKS